MTLPSYLDLKKQENIAILAMKNKTNVLTPQIMEELGQVLMSLDKDPEVRIIILTGNGAKSFIAGADIKTMQNLDIPGAITFITNLHLLIDTIRRMNKLVIAAINGHCFGGGLELVVCCDFIVAADNAIFGMQEVALGIPSVIEASMIPFLVGFAKTREWLYGGNVFSAQEAFDCRLVNKIVSPDNLMDEAMIWAKTFARNPNHTMTLQKKLMNRWLENAGLDQSIKNGIDSFGLAYGYAETTHRLAQTLKQNN